MNINYQRYILNAKDIKPLPLIPIQDIIPDYYNNEINGRKSMKELLKLSKAIVKMEDDQIPCFNRTVYISLNYGFNTALNTSDPGTGKTYLACAVALYLGLSIFIVCTATMVDKWKDVASKFGISDKIRLVISFQSLRSKKNKDENTKVLNHGYLSRTDIVLDDKKKTKVCTFSATQKTKDMIEEGVIFIFDEIQFIKDNTSNQFNACYELIRKIPQNVSNKSKVLLLSRTPIDKPKFAESLLKMLGVLKGDMFRFVSAFGGGSVYRTSDWDYMVNEGAKINGVVVNNISRCIRLNSATNFRVYSWFLYRDVFRTFLSGEMPKLKTVEADIANGFYKFPIEIEKQITVELDAMASCLHYDDDKKTMDTSGLALAMPHMNNLQRLKADKFRELTLEALQIPHSKVILFVNFMDVINILEEAITKAGYQVAILTGKTPQKKRKMIIDKFQEENDEVRVIISNTQVGGVGIDLDDIFGVFPRFKWMMPDFKTIEMIQALKRAIRKNTKQLTKYPAMTARIVFTDTPIGTYELRILQICFEKMNIINESLAKEDKTLFPTRIVRYDINNKPIAEYDTLPKYDKKPKAIVYSNLKNNNNKNDIVVFGNNENITNILKEIKHELPKIDGTDMYNVD